MKVHYRYRQTVYHITYTRWTGPRPELPAPRLDGEVLPGPAIPLRDDRREHAVEQPFV
jgi:hypothetical protein